MLNPLFVPGWSLITCALLLACAFLLRTRGNPESSVQSAAAALLLFGMMDAAYAYGLAVNHPAAAYHRFITITLAGPAWILFARALYCFPARKPGRILNIASLLLLVLYLAAVLYFIIGAVSTGPVRVHEHYWNFRVRRASLVLGMVLMILLMSMLVLGMAAALRAKSRPAGFARYVPVLGAVWAFTGFLFAGSVFTLAQTAKVTLEVAVVLRFIAVATTFAPLTWLFLKYGNPASPARLTSETAASLHRP